MGEKLLRDQNQISLQHPMPVDDTGSSSSVFSVSGETVQLQYFNSGTLTNDAGQAAGVAVVAQLANKNILSELGDRIATFNDTSLSFTSTALTTEVKLDVSKLELTSFDTLENKLTAVVAGLSNGEFAVDYRTGTIFGLKTSTTTTLTSTAYKINSGEVGVSDGGTYTSGILSMVGAVVADATALVLKTAGAATTLFTDLYGRLVVTIGTAFSADLDSISTKPVVVDNVRSTALEAGHIISTSAKRVYAVRAFSTATAGQFIQVHNTTAAPGAGAVPSEVFAIGASSNGSITFPQGRSFSTGVYVCNSSTAATYTAGAADCLFSVDIEA